MKSQLVIPARGGPAWVAEHRTRDGRLIIAEGETLNESLEAVAERLIELNRIDEVVQ